MKRSTIMVLLPIALIAFSSCNNNRSNNISISQTTNFDRHSNKYAVETKLKITNHFGFTRHVSIWEDETSYKSDIDDFLKLQRAKADSVCKRYH